MQLEIENAMLEALNTPLAFEYGGLSCPRSATCTAEVASPEMMSCLLACINSPAVATVCFELSSVTARVGMIQLEEIPVQNAPTDLFSAVPPALVDALSPHPRHSAPPKTRATSTPSHCSARQAAAANPTLAAQCVVLRLVQNLGKLGPKDKMSQKAATTLMQQFQEPLSDGDIAAIAKLTGLDPTALKIAAGMAGMASAEEAADV